MKDLSQFPVSFPYGATTAPYTPSRPHLGDDRAAPAGTPVIVNGVKIGEVGSTGLSTGNHCHIGRFVNGSATNPQGQGFNLTPPVSVTTVAYDSSNGNYVRLTDGNGVQWVYLHLSKQLVSVGDKLEGEEDMLNYDQVDSMAHAYLNDSVANNSGLKQYIGQPAESVIAAFNGATQRAAFLKHIEDLEKGVVTKTSVLSYIDKNLK